MYCSAGLWTFAKCAWWVLPVIPDPWSCPPVHCTWYMYVCRLGKLVLPEQKKTARWKVDETFKDKRGKEKKTQKKISTQYSRWCLQCLTKMARHSSPPFQVLWEIHHWARNRGAAERHKHAGLGGNQNKHSGGALPAQPPDGLAGHQPGPERGHAPQRQFHQHLPLLYPQGGDLNAADEPLMPQATGVRCNIVHFHLFYFFSLFLSIPLFWLLYISLPTYLSYA